MKTRSIFDRLYLLLAALMLVVIAYDVAYACTAFFKYEETNGLNKICYYNHLGSKVAYTVKSYELCPITIQVRH